MEFDTFRIKSADVRFMSVLKISENYVIYRIVYGEEIEATN